MVDTVSGEILINCEADLILVRKTIRDSARILGFSRTDTTRIVTATSELARNIQKYAQTGVVSYTLIEEPTNKGITIVFSDNGPGIADINLAMTPGYSSSRGLGMGLSGSKKLMDNMKIDSVVGKGTTVTISKWLSHSITSYDL